MVNFIVAALAGAPDFEAVMERFMSKKSAFKVVYCVFDVIYIEGHSIANKPLIERKNIFLDLNLDHDNVKLAKEKHLEGIVLKKANSPYEINKRSHSWLKVINYDYTDVLITGYTRGYKVSSILPRWNCSWVYGIHAERGTK